MNKEILLKALAGFGVGFAISTTYGNNIYVLIACALSGILIGIL